MVECKPINLQNTVMVRTKARAAKDFCESRGWLYELTDVVLIIWDKLAELERSSVVKLSERTRKKLDANPLYPARPSRLR